MLQTAMCVGFKGEDKIRGLADVFDTDFQTFHRKHFCHLPIFLVLHCTVPFVTHSPVICVITAVYTTNLPKVKTLKIRRKQICLPSATAQSTKKLVIPPF